MSAKLLSSLVQTKSIELVMAPIAAQVSQLIILNEAGEREGVPMPLLVSYARSVCTSIQSLVLAGQNLVAESSDKVFKKEMPEACLAVTDAGKNLLEASSNLIKQPFSREVRYTLVDSARNILETTMKVLLVYDKAEVQKIVCAACWVIDRLGLTEAVTSMDGLIISFRGFSESLMLLVSLCDKRQRELSNSKQRTQLLSAMAILKKAAGLLSSTMQVYFKKPTVPSSKVNRDYVVGQIKFACTEIIKIVENRDEENSSAAEVPSMYSTMKKAKNQLHPSVAMDTNNQMDCYLDAIVRSSMAVANTCHDSSRDRIVEACQNVLETRSDLIALQSLMASAPDAVMSRRKFDEMTQQLSLGLKDLDSEVTLAIVEQIDDIFSHAEQPIKQLLDVSTTPYTSKNDKEPNVLMVQKADAFQKHALKLVQMSKHAASLSSDTQKIQLIKGLTNELERLVPVVVTDSFTVKQNPFHQAAIERLGSVSTEWLNKLHVLTDALDDITDMQELLKVTGSCLYNDVTCLQEALLEQNGFKTAQTTDSLLCRGQRYVQITKKAIARTDDPFNSELLATIDELERGLGSLSIAVKKKPLDVSDRDKVHSLATILGEKINAIQCKVTGTLPANAKLQASNDEFQNQAQPLSMKDLKVLPQPMPEKPTENKTDRKLSPKMSRSEKQEKRQSQPTPHLSESHTSDLNSSLSLSFESLVESDEEINSTDRRSLIGISGSGQLFGEPIYLSCTSKAPVTRLIQAAKKGNRDNIEKFIKNIISQVTRLMGLAEKCVEKSNNMDQVRQIRVTSGEIEKLTPIITQAARDVAASPRDRTTVERLQLIGREWASKAHVLGDAIDAIVVPWSAAASKLALAAACGDTGELKKQINNINDEAVRLRQLALSAIAAADAEDYAMDPGNENEDFERNPASFQRINLLRATAEETDKVIPELILAAQSLVVNPADVIRLEHLEFLRRVWACNVNNLITAVDDIIVGTSAPVEHLTNAAMINDSQALQDRIRMVVSYTRTLKEMAAASITGCTNSKKAVLVESTVASIERLTTDLQDTAGAVLDLNNVHSKSFEQELAFMSIEEKMKLLGREWATKVHLLTALVDDLTAHVSAPVDRLAGAALAVTKAELSKKRLMEREFEVRAQELSSRVARVRGQASKAVEQSSLASQVRIVRVTGDFIDRLTPQVIGSARALADNPDQPTVEHFQMLRRQWASKAQVLISTLRELHDANPIAVEAVIDDLLATRALQPATSFESVDESSHLFSSPNDAKLSFNTSLPVSSHSPKPERKPSPPKTKPKRRNLKDFDEVERSLTDSEVTPKQRVPIGASSSETDIRSLLVRELHDRFSSNESLKRSNWDARYWAKLEVNRKKHQRAFSMADLSKNNSELWRSESEEDLRNRKSSRSIARAAQCLEDEVDQWEEENNSIVKVAKKMAQQMMQMSQLARNRGRQQNKLEMSNTAKAIAANSKIIENFARTIADACADQRSREDLLYYAECVPTMSTQLTIIASVKAAAPNDRSADAMLVRNAENLMQAVVKTLRAAEAASVKDFIQPSPTTADEVEAADLAFQWKKKLQNQRKQELFTTSRDHLGLRKREAKSTPSLVDIVHV